MKYFLPCITAFFIILNTEVYSQNKPLLYKDQSSTINSIISFEKIPKNQNSIIKIVNYIDKTYTDIPEKIKNGDKLTIFFDPAHGKDHTGEWRGITTNRIGVTGLPEEYYSIFYSRKLYNLLKSNNFIKIVTSKDFQAVLDGKSESYHYLRFAQTVSMASDAGAFLIIAQHLNNVSIFNKADGRINIPGIHMARDRQNRLLLQNIKGSYSGFLTLYNKFDASGFSREYALKIKNSLVDKGYTPNNWEYGAVGDDRFTYYMDFPVSVIYENGFISNPEEEKKILDPYYMDGIVKSQYDTLLETVKTIYGIDITGSEAKIINVNYNNRIEMLKLARIAIYYFKNAETAKAKKTVEAMNKYSNNTDFADSVEYYNSILKKISQSETLYKRGIAQKKKKQYKSARKSFTAAVANLDSNAIYDDYKTRYNNELNLNRGKKTIASKSSEISQAAKTKESSIIINSSAITKPVIITMEEGTTIKQAIIDALNPDKESLEKIENRMLDYKKVKWVKYKKWSKKHKKNVYAWKKTTEDFKFKTGIYIVNLDKNLNILKADSVSSVYLNPDKYQNQQYLKNSYFENTELEKNI